MPRIKNGLILVASLKMNRKKWFFLDASILFILLFFYAGHIHADLSEFSCGSLQNAYGPFDYRNDKDKLGVVEAYHFSTEVASLIKGKSGSLGGDIDYTLRAFPNHPRALMAMVQLGWREKTTKVSGAQYSVECYLHRAIRFRDDDGMVKMIYAVYLVKKGRTQDAFKQLDEAASLTDDNTSLNYNIGLVYLELKDFDKALSYAHKAYLSGFPLPGLRDKLKRAGKWKDPVLLPEEVNAAADRGDQAVPGAVQGAVPAQPGQ